MLTTYRFIKTIIITSTFASLAWFGVSAFAEQDVINAQTQAEEAVDKKIKLLSEMTAEERAKLTKEEVKRLEEIEAKMKQLDKPQY